MNQSDFAYVDHQHQNSDSSSSTTIYQIRENELTTLSDSINSYIHHDATTSSPSTLTQRKSVHYPEYTVVTPTIENIDEQINKPKMKIKSSKKQKKQPCRLSFRSSIVLLCIILIVICCAVTWFLGARTAHDAVSNVATLVRQSVVKHASDNITTQIMFLVRALMSTKTLITTTGDIWPKMAREELWTVSDEEGFVGIGSSILKTYQETYVASIGIATTVTNNFVRVGGLNYTLGQSMNNLEYAWMDNTTHGNFDYFQLKQEAKVQKTDWVKLCCALV